MFIEAYELTKDLSRENDAYKLIRYLAEYRYRILYEIYKYTFAYNLCVITIILTKFLIFQSFIFKF